VDSINLAKPKSVPSRNHLAGSLCFRFDITMDDARFVRTRARRQSESQQPVSPGALVHPGQALA
jgi:hypothetical protein